MTTKRSAAPRTFAPRTPQVGPDGDARLLSVAEVAARLGVAEKWVRNKIASRDLVFVKVGGHVRFRPEDIEAYIAQQRVEAVQR
jgi:excisionase family DNA binding protein